MYTMHLCRTPESVGDARLQLYMPCSIALLCLIVECFFIFFERAFRWALSVTFCHSMWPFRIRAVGTYFEVHPRSNFEKLSNGHEAKEAKSLLHIVEFCSKGLFRALSGIARVCCCRLQSQEVADRGLRLPASPIYIP